MTLKAEDLDRFNGTDTWYWHWLGNLAYTEGVKFLAEEGKTYWLLDVIASYQATPRVFNDPELRYMQFWNLAVDLEKQSGVLVCVADDDTPEAVRQVITYTDFPLPEVRVWVERGAIPAKVEGNRGSTPRLVEAMVAMLPGER